MTKGMRRLLYNLAPLGAAGALSVMALAPATAAHAASGFMIRNDANGYCLNGALTTSHAEVTLTPCNAGDLHMVWYGGGQGEIVDGANNYCLNGALGTSHAEVTLTPCNAGDAHMRWTYNGELVDGANGYCLNGALGTSHAEVTLTPCNGSDSHMLWAEPAV